MQKCSKTILLSKKCAWKEKQYCFPTGASFLAGDPNILKFVRLIWRGKPYKEIQTSYWFKLSSPVRYYSDSFFISIPSGALESFLLDEKQGRLSKIKQGLWHQARRLPSPSYAVLLNTMVFPKFGHTRVWPRNGSQEEAVQDSRGDSQWLRSTRSRFRCPPKKKHSSRGIRSVLSHRSERCPGWLENKMR